MIDIAKIEEMIRGDYDERVEKHMEICAALFSVSRPRNEYRAETGAERKKRHYWSIKLGEPVTKLGFWTAAPKLVSGAIIVSSMEEAERAFLKDAKAPEARRYVHKVERKKRKRSNGIKYLKPRDFIRVRILHSGQAGVITAWGSKGYRVTIDPKISWKNKFRRWLLASDFQVTDGKELPK